MSPSGSRYYCSTEQHNDSLSDLTWAGLRTTGESAKRMWKSSRLCNQQRRPAASWKICEQVTKALDRNRNGPFLWLRKDKFISHNGDCLHVKIWAHELTVKTNSTELNTSMCVRKAPVALVILMKHLKHLIHSSVYPPKVYLPYTQVHNLSHILWPVTVCVIHKEIISFGATVQSEECDSLIFWMIGWQLAT